MVAIDVFPCRMPAPRPSRMLSIYSKSEVLEGWHEGPLPGCTTVPKVLQILATEGAVGHEKAGRS